MRRIGPVVLLATLAGCPDGPPGPAPEPAPLATSEGWARVTDPARDVFAAMRPADATCDDSGYFVDPVTRALEIQTDLCDYLTLRHATLEPLAPGDRVTIRAYHDALTSDTLGEGYLGLALDGAVVWEETTPIPAPAAEIAGEFTIERALPAGAELQFHVHNHGANSWELRSVEVTPGG